MKARLPVYWRAAHGSTVVMFHLFLEGEERRWWRWMALPGERGISGRLSGGESQRSAQDMVCRLLSPAARGEGVSEHVNMRENRAGITIILCNNITPTQLLQKERKCIH